jgi:hypothetical protein
MLSGGERYRWSAATPEPRHDLLHYTRLSCVMKGQVVAHHGSYNQVIICAHLVRNDTRRLSPGNK